MEFFSTIKQHYSFLRTLTSYSSVFAKFVRDSVFRFKKDSTLIFTTGFIGSLLQVGAIGQLIYYARMVENGKALDILGYNFEPRSAGFFILSMVLLLVFLLLSSLLLYYSRSKIINLSCTYETFCSKKVFSIVARLRRIFSPGLLSLYDSKTILRLSGRDARICGRMLRMLLRLLQPTITFTIALGALLYIDIFLTIIVLILTGISVLFHYKNNIRGASSSKKMEEFAPGAQKERHKIFKVITGIKQCEDELGTLIDGLYDEGEIKSNLDGFRGRYQTLENSRLINEMLIAILLFVMAIILGGKAIIQNSHWGSLIVYLLALRYCLSHLNRMVVSFTSINRFYPIFSRYFFFVGFFDSPEPEKELLARKYKLHVESTAVEGSMAFMKIENGDILAVVAPFKFDFYKTPIYIDCLLGHKKGLTEKALKSMNIVTETDGYAQPLSLRKLFNFPCRYNHDGLLKDLRNNGISEEMISRLPDDINSPIPKESWNHMGPEIKYSLGLLSAIYSDKQWLVIDRKVLNYLSPQNLDSFFRELEERIILVVSNGELDCIGRNGETHVAIIDGQHLIGLGDIQWFETQRNEIQERIASVKKDMDRTLNREEEDEYDEDDDDI